MTTKARNALIAISILAFPFACFLIFFIAEFHKPIAPLKPLPGPNGYDEFQKAAHSLASDAGTYGKPGTPELRTLVAANSNALVIARSGLQMQCRVPVQYSMSYVSNHLEQLANMKQLGQAFAAEGKLAEADGRFADAAASYLDTIRLGMNAGNGGTMLDELVGIAIENIGSAELQGIVRKLDKETCRNAASALEEISSQRQTWNEIREQENNWSRSTFRGFGYEMARVLSRKSNASMIAGCERKYNAQRERTQQLMIDLASRAYRLDKGQSLQNMSDLVPDYLKALPPPVQTNLIQATSVQTR